MRCFSCCSAASYDLPTFLSKVAKDYKATQYRDVVHFDLSKNQGGGDVFYFPYGCLVCWGLTEKEEAFFLSLIQPHEYSPNVEKEIEVLNYTYGEQAKLQHNELILPDKECFTLLSFSHGLAQSVKLGTFEERIHKTYNTMKHIPVELARWGRISLNRKEIRRRIGALFLERSSINLHFEVLDTPEFFWEHPELESFYAIISNELDINVRVEVLNQRLDVLHELFHMLNQELNHQHSSRLELTIVILIVIEVTLLLFKEFLGWM